MCMTSEKIPPVGRDRPFPWPCVECNALAVFPQVTDYTTTVKHDGRAYTIRIPDLAIATCRNCGEQVFGGAEDDRIRDALRAEIGLLRPPEIQRHRAEFKLSQQELA